jgi:hypothetical protein
LKFLSNPHFLPKDILAAFGFLFEKFL